ncbi:DUF2460 domain-containing protein [Acinetobacter sp. ANC 3926]|uniref:DUF2460 domain-containing protein n=1 Tax=Acinetobacter genomosp. 15BJ TaxID=106651 RepID=UPI001F4A44CF|nr:DUF2460 domain-containing protein [Acinetobacter genomosp. 15BJ]MCH7291021.1 DUF2460 domain-containing protein [Acinetobacter genomosp. 15BJ]
MSNELFPELPGLEWDLTKTPTFNTKIMTSVNGRELRASYQAVPKYEISMSYAFLRENKNRKEFQILESFFLARRGAFDSFLFQMPDDFEFDCTFVGDGVTKTFQLYKQLNNLKIPIGNTFSPTQPTNPKMWKAYDSKLMWDINQDKLMWDNTYMQVTSDGKVVLSSPLEEGVVINVKGIFYYRCRFKDDEQQYANFMHKLWKASKVELIATLGNRL